MCKKGSILLTSDSLERVFHTLKPKILKSYSLNS
jgi:hypothetical protein